MSNPLPPDVVAAALNVPHQLFIADRVLRIDVGGFSSTITLSNTMPNGAIQPCATITMSTDELKAMADQIQAAIGGRSEAIKADLKAFAKVI